MLSIIALLTSVLLGCSPDNQNQQPETGQDEDRQQTADVITLHILHTNDMHANIEGFGKIAGYIDKIRKTNDHVLYLDAGDISSGNPVVDLKNGKPIVTLLNEMKLDAMTIGNHEFDYGQGNFRDNQNLAKFPWLSANTVIKDQNVPIKKATAL